MANTIGFGQAAVNNTNGFGKAPTNNTIDFGEVCADSWSPETNLTGAGATPSFSNTKSIQLDGMDAYVDCSSAISSVSADNEGTFSLWYKPSSLSTNSNIITLTDSSASDVYFIIGWSNPSYLNNVFVQLRNGLTTTGFLLRTDTSPLSVGVWTHIAVVQNGVSAVLYINGIAVPQTFLIPNNDQKWLNDFTINEFNIGKLVISSGSFNFTVGNLDEVSYFSSALSSSDMLSIYNSGVPTDLTQFSTTPVFYYRFEGTGTTAIDSGSGGNDGILDNTVVRSTDVPT